MHKALHNPFKQAPSPNAWSRGCAQAEGGSGCPGTGHRQPCGVCPRRPAAADRGRPGAPGLVALYTSGALLTGGIDSKKLVRRWRGGRGESSSGLRGVRAIGSLKITGRRGGRERGEGGLDGIKYFLPATAGLTASISPPPQPPRGGSVSKLQI